MIGPHIPQRGGSLLPEPPASPHASTSAATPPSSTSPSKSATAAVARPTPASTTSPASKTTTFVLPRAREAEPGATTLKPSESLLGRLGRKLSIGKRGQVVRRVSLGSRASPPASTTPPAPASEKGRETKDVDGLARSKSVGLQRGLRVLGRSKSEGTGTPKRSRALELDGADALEYVYGRRGARKEGEREATLARENEGQARLYWEERLGICWDGREQVHPDFSLVANYTSNSDVLPPALATPARVVYASTLSTFPPRPPLKSHVSHPPPTTVLTPASQIIADYRLREQRLAASSPTTSPSLTVPTPYFPPSDDNDTMTTATSESATPIPTPVPARTRAPSTSSSPHRPANGTSKGYESDVSSSEVPRFGRESEDSSTSLESLGSLRDPPPPAPVPAPACLKQTPRPVIRFALVDQGPVPPSTMEVVRTPSRQSLKQLTRADDSEDDHDREADSLAGEVDWRECE